jgi:NAD(P)-dependent dehydrogenase (short-subunit alcohol dehydrogenase family)
MKNRFENKVVIVTGGAAGMGETHCRAFADEGAVVYLTDIDETLGQALANEIGENCTFVRHDVADEDSWNNLAALVGAQHGHLDVLVQNAGFALTNDFDNTDTAFFEKMLAVNTKGNFFALRSMKPLLKAADAASVVIISSTAGKLASPFMYAYGISKGALSQMLRTYTVELAKDGIRVNAILPGIIDTPTSRLATDIPEIRAFILSHTPMARIARPEEVTAAVLFLASDAASYITGVELPVDGGVLAN